MQPSPDIDSPAPARKGESRPAHDRYDAVVVGAGFGGLAAALCLVERGHRVLVCETLDYPGGCAATFKRDGYRFEAGATLFAGFEPGQLFHRWIGEHGMGIQLEPLDPVVELRSPELTLCVPRDRGRFREALLGLPGVSRPGLGSFLDRQARVADCVWGLLDRPELLPPLSARGIGAVIRQLPRLAPALACAGRSLGAVMARHGVSEHPGMRLYADALCQITLQCTASEAEAPFALATMDYYFRTTHVRGGIGELAWAMVEAIRARGGEVTFTNRVRGLRRERDGWRVDSRRGEVRARVVLANLLPQGITRLLGDPRAGGRRLRHLARAVEGGWGACMLYLVAREPPGAGQQPLHLQLVQDAALPLQEGNHLFVSISGGGDPGRAPAGHRTITVSTHVPLVRLAALPPHERAARIQRIQDHMERGLERLAPEWWTRVVHRLPASPRTFERFTGRDGGFVGGIPRRAGPGNYLQMSPVEVAPGLLLVGDTAFPGQSTLAAALGGHRAAAVAAARLRRTGVDKAIPTEEDRTPTRRSGSA